MEGRIGYIEPGEQIVYQNTTSQSFLYNANIEDVTAWQKGLFYLEENNERDSVYFRNDGLMSPVQYK